jgi:hypothetical protein
MYASVPSRGVSYSWLIRYFGRVSGILLAVGWLAFVIADFVRGGVPVLSNYYQGAMLAIVFIGYVVGWRYEVLGGALTIVGTLGFMALYLAMFKVAAPVGIVCFAVPGVCYLIAHGLDKPHQEQMSS